MFKRLCTVTCVVLAAFTNASAQVLTRSELQPAGGLAPASTGGGVDVVPQATIEFNADAPAKPTVAVEALDVFFGTGQNWAFHFRATLPTSSSTPPEGQSIYTKPNQNLRTQLLDAFGGVANVSASGRGDFTRGAAMGSFDMRGGLKLIEAPRARDSAVGEDEAYTVSAALTAGANGRLVLSGVTSTNSPVTLILVGSAFFNRLLESELATRFTTPLKSTSVGLNGELAVNVPALKFYLTLGYKWSSDPLVGDQFLFSFNPTR